MWNEQRKKMRIIAFNFHHNGIHAIHYIVFQSVDFFVVVVMSLIIIEANLQKWLKLYFYHIYLTTFHSKEFAPWIRGVNWCKHMQETFLHVLLSMQTIILGDHSNRLYACPSLRSNTPLHTRVRTAPKSTRSTSTQIPRRVFNISTFTRDWHS